MMQKILQKKANRNIIIFICMVLIALLCRILGKISFQYVLNGIVRSIIYIGLYIGWAISIHKRVVQKSVKNTLLLISGLMISWFIIRTIKYFFTIDANIERYLWYSYYLPLYYYHLCHYLCKWRTVDAGHRRRYYRCFMSDVCMYI